MMKMTTMIMVGNWPGEQQDEGGGSGHYRNEGGEYVYRSADLVNILAQILDSERNLSGSADPMITAGRGFIQFLGPDFGFWLLGRSDRSDHGSQRSRGNLIFSRLCAGCHAVEKMTLLT